MRQCIFCMQWKEEKEFNREHIILEEIGGKGDKDIQGSYKIQTDEKGRLHYILEDGTDIEERDGICLYVAADQLPDYRIISIKPYRFLTMEVEKI